MKRCLVVTILLSMSGAVRASDHAAAPHPGMQPMRSISATDSLLVIAPHPDDESLCCAGVIDLAQRAGAKVAIAWVTSGDGSRSNAMIIGRTLLPGKNGYRELERRREGEAREAAATWASRLIDSSSSAIPTVEYFHSSKGTTSRRGARRGPAPPPCFSNAP